MSPRQHAHLHSRRRLPVPTALLALAAAASVVGAPATAGARAGSGPQAEIVSVAVPAERCSDCSPDVRVLSASAGNDALPAISPDGRSIAFVSDRGGRDAVYLMGSDGSGQTRLWVPPPSAGTVVRLGQPVWSPDGGSVLVAVSNLDFPKAATGLLYLIPRVGGDARQLGSTWSDTAVSASFAHDGRYIAYQTRSENVLYSGSESSGVLTVDGTLVALGDAGCTAWSPRADRLASVSSRTMRLTVAGPRGERRWRLKLRVTGCPVWSGSGKTIAVVHDGGSPRRPGNPVVYLVDPAARHAHRLVALPRPADGGSYALSWSANSGWIAAATGNTTVLLHPTGRELTLLSDAAFPVWSPRGGTLAFADTTDKTATLRVWPSLAGLFAATGALAAPPSWSPDGSRLVFARNRPPG